MEVSMIGYKRIAISGLALMVMILAGCQKESPMVSLGLEEVYTIARMQKLQLSSPFTGEGYRWSLLLPEGTEQTLSASRDMLFISETTGIHELRFMLIDGVNPLDFRFTVNVVDEEVAYSPYLAHVYEYCPAPGQFINKMPWYDEGDTAEDMRRKAEEALSGTNEEMVSLGAFGGYITFGFDHTGVNVDGEYDFMILGNAFYDAGMEDEKAGSCEPGIVMVSLDVNGNGLPDDEWYELAGSEYASEATVHGYSITYHAPDLNKPPVPDGRYLTDTEYIPWEDSLGESGYVAKNYENTQSYYPLWLTEQQLTFSGSRLAPNGEDVFGNGSYFKLYSYAWGYVDNHPNTIAKLNSFDIGWAVDRYGMPVRLPGVDFIRVYTAINQYCGRIGETSTEIIRAQDLHVE